MLTRVPVYFNPAVSNKPIGRNLENIGLPVASADEHQALVERALREGEPISAVCGTYFRWRCGDGAELWVRLDRDGRFEGVDPYFEGDGVMRVRLSTIGNNGRGLLAGSVTGWLLPGEEDEAEESCRCCIDLPDFACHLHRPRSAVADFRVAAFADELEIYDTVDAFERAQAHETVRFAPDAFFASTFVVSDGADEDPGAEAVMFGHVLATEERRNPATQARYHTALIRTAGATINVVAAPDLVTAPIVVGGVLGGSFWLSGAVRAWPAVSIGDPSARNLQ